MGTGGIWRARGAQVYNGGQRAKPPVRGSGAKPPEAEKLVAFGRLMNVTNLRSFLIFGNADNHRYLFVSPKGPRTLLPPSNRSLHRSPRDPGAEYRWSLGGNAPRSHIYSNNLRLSKCPSSISLPPPSPKKFGSRRIP